MNQILAPISLAQNRIVAPITLGVVSNATPTHIGPTPPESPVDGQGWWDGSIYAVYDAAADGGNGTWVVPNPFGVTSTIPALAYRNSTGGGYINSTGGYYLATA